MRLRACAPIVFGLHLAWAEPGYAQGQAPPASPVHDSVGILLVAHGADSSWNARVHALAAAVGQGGRVRGPVATAFLMGPEAATRRFQDQVAALAARGAKRVVVVPVLVSSHSGHFEQIRFLARQTSTLDSEMAHHLRMAGLEPGPAHVPVVVARALDDAPELADVVADRARAAEPNAEGRALFLVGHGPNTAEDYAAWMANLRLVAEAVRTATGFATVAVELVRDDAPTAVRTEAVRRARELVELQRMATGRDVVVVPLAISRGALSLHTVPSDLAGLPIVYAGEPILHHDAIVRWVERRVREALVP